MQAVIAIALPWAVTAFWLRSLASSAPPLDWPTALGYGFFIGMYLTVLLLNLADAAGLGLHTHLVLVVWLLAAVAGIILAGKRRWAASGGSGLEGASAPESLFPKRIGRWLWWGLLALILVRLGIIAAEVALRPVTPWDAWTTWLLRSRVWFEYVTLIPFVGVEQWQTADQPYPFTTEAHHYPPTVSIIPTWVTLNAGVWNEPLALAPWVAALAAMLLGVYGQVRRLGGTPLDAILVSYLLISIPMVTVHAALAGYADLWTAATVTLAGVALWLWKLHRERVQLLLALPLLAALPTLKLEGSVWLVALVAGMLLWLLKPRTVLLLAAVVVVSIAAWAGLGGITIEIPGFGTIILRPDQVMIPGLVSLGLGMQPEAIGALLRALFLDANWHLLWFVALALSPLALYRSIRDSQFRGPAYMIAIMLSMLLALFLLSDASRWVISQTTVNRLLLHITPILLVFIWMTLRLPSPSNGRSG